MKARRQIPLLVGAALVLFPVILLVLPLMHVKRHRERAARFEVGRTTQAEVEALLGEPDFGPLLEVDSETYYYGYDECPRFARWLRRQGPMQYLVPDSWATGATVKIGFARDETVQSVSVFENEPFTLIP